MQRCDKSLHLSSGNEKSPPLTSEEIWIFSLFFRLTGIQDEKKGVLQRAANGDNMSPLIISKSSVVLGHRQTEEITPGGYWSIVRGVPLFPPRRPDPFPVSTATIPIQVCQHVRKKKENDSDEQEGSWVVLSPPILGLLLWVSAANEAENWSVWSLTQPVYSKKKMSSDRFFTASHLEKLDLPFRVRRPWMFQASGCCQRSLATVFVSLFAHTFSLSLIFLSLSHFCPFVGAKPFLT